MRRADETGVALLAVLLLVAVMSALAVALLDDVRFTVRRTANAESVAQARWYAIGAETLARAQMRKLAGTEAARDAETWNGRVVRLPVEGGQIQARISDATGCFNLNSLVEGAGEVLRPRAEGARQFTALLAALGFAPREAELLAAALTDWIDSDQIRDGGGAEDEAYARGVRAYRTAGTLIAEPSELRAVRGFTPDVYRRIRPFVCALPTSDLSPINVNALSPDRGVLLTMLTDGALRLGLARRVIEARPAGGWNDGGDFWAAPAMPPEAVPGNAAYNQVAVRPRFIALDTEVAYRDAEVVASALFDTSAGEPRLAARRWTRLE